MNFAATLGHQPQKVRFEPGNVALAGPDSNYGPMTEQCEQFGVPNMYLATCKKMIKKRKIVQIKRAFKKG